MCLHISHMVTNKILTGEISIDSKQMSERHDTTIKVCNIISIVLHTKIFKQSVLKPVSHSIPLNLDTLIVLKMLPLFDKNNRNTK